MSVAVQQEPRTLEEAMARKNIAKLQDLAVRIGCSPRSLSSWIHGSHRPSGYYLGRLSHVLCTDARRFFTQSETQQVELSRRDLLGSLTALPFALSVANGASQAPAPIMGMIDSLEAITLQYRALQRNGVTDIGDSLTTHITTVTKALESTIHDRARHDLWRLLAQAQLLERLSITKTHELGRAKTLNESAISAAQRSGDSELTAAAVGHLAHLYLLHQQDVSAARHYINIASELAGPNKSLRGWLAILLAAASSAEGKRDECLRWIATADELADGTPHVGRGADPYFTDFNTESVAAFGGNCRINVGEPSKAYERLTGINLANLAHNRHASAFYDISRAFAEAGEFHEAQVYAIQSIDSALATNRMYIIPRFLKLTSKIRERDPGNAEALSILAYANDALQRK